MLLAEYEATLCPGCGQPQHTAQDPHLSELWEIEPVLCFPCRAKDIRATKVHNNDANDAPNAFSYAVKLREPRSRARDD